MFNGYNEAQSSSYQNYYPERAGFPSKKNQTMSQWPYPSQLYGQSSQLWPTPIGFPNFVPSRCSCLDCQKTDRPADHRCSRSNTHNRQLHANGTVEPAKHAGKSGAPVKNNPPSCFWESERKVPFYRPYETDKLKESNEIITSPSGQEILLLGQKDGKRTAQVETGDKTGYGHGFSQDNTSATTSSTAATTADPSYQHELDHVDKNYYGSVNSERFAKTVPCKQSEANVPSLHTYQGLNQTYEFNDKCTLYSGYSNLDTRHQGVEYNKQSNSVANGSRDAAHSYPYNKDDSTRKADTGHAQVKPVEVEPKLPSCNYYQRSCDEGRHGAGATGASTSYDERTTGAPAYSYGHNTFPRSYQNVNHHPYYSNPAVLGQFDSNHKVTSYSNQWKNMAIPPYGQDIMSRFGMDSLYDYQVRDFSALHRSKVPYGYCVDKSGNTSLYNRSSTHLSSNGNVLSDTYQTSDCARSDVYGLPTFVNQPNTYRYPHTSQAAAAAERFKQDIQRNGTKISPLRLMRKKKFIGSMHEAQAQNASQLNSSGDGNGPVLDVRRFLATWADEEEESQPQMVVLDCQNIDPEQAELLRLYENPQIRTVELSEGLLSVREPGTSAASEFVTSTSDNQIQVVTGESVDTSSVVTDLSQSSTRTKEQNVVVPPVSPTPAGEQQSKRTKPTQEEVRREKKMKKLESEKMDKWTEKKFSFIKRAELSKAEENKRNEEGRKRIFEVQQYLAQSDVQVTEQRTEGQKSVIIKPVEPVHDNKADLASLSFEECFQDPPLQSIPSPMEEDSQGSSVVDMPIIASLPTSEYRKNKFLDYAQPEQIVNSPLNYVTRALEEADCISNVFDSPQLQQKQPEVVAEKKESEERMVDKPNTTSVIKNYLDVSKEKQVAEVEQDEEVKKIKKMEKKERKKKIKDGNVEKTFSIQKTEDLKISLKVLKKETNATENVEVHKTKENAHWKKLRGVVNKVKGKLGNVKKDDEDRKMPVLKIRKISKTEEEKSAEDNNNVVGCSSVYSVVNKTSCKRKHAKNDDFRVEEVDSSSAIKLRLKRTNSSRTNDSIVDSDKDEAKSLVGVDTPADEEPAIIEDLLLPDEEPPVSSPPVSPPPVEDTSAPPVQTKETPQETVDDLDKILDEETNENRQDVVTSLVIRIPDGEVDLPGDDKDEAAKCSSEQNLAEDVLTDVVGEVSPVVESTVAVDDDVCGLVEHDTCATNTVDNVVEETNPVPDTEHGGVDKIVTEDEEKRTVQNTEAQTLYDQEQVLQTPDFSTLTRLEEGRDGDLSKNIIENEIRDILLNGSECKRVSRCKRPSSMPPSKSKKLEVVSRSKSVPHDILFSCLSIEADSDDLIASEIPLPASEPRPVSPTSRSQSPTLSEISSQSFFSCLDICQSPFTSLSLNHYRNPSPPAYNIDFNERSQVGIRNSSPISLKFSTDSTRSKIDSVDFNLSPEFLKSYETQSTRSTSNISIKTDYNEFCLPEIFGQNKDCDVLSTPSPLRQVNYKISSSVSSDVLSRNEQSSSAYHHLERSHSWESVENEVVNSAPVVNKQSEPTPVKDVEQRLDVITAPPSVPLLEVRTPERENTPPKELPIAENETIDDKLELDPVEIAPPASPIVEADATEGKPIEEVEVSVEKDEPEVIENADVPVAGECEEVKPEESSEETFVVADDAILCEVEQGEDVNVIVMNDDGDNLESEYYTLEEEVEEEVVTEVVEEEVEQETSKEELPVEDTTVEVPADLESSSEILPVNNWPYLEEEVPLSPNKTKQEEQLSPPLDTTNSVIVSSYLVKNIPDCQNVVPTYISDQAFFASLPGLLQSGVRAGRRSSLALEYLQNSRKLSATRRKTFDGVSVEQVLSEDSSDEQDQFKCKLSLDRIGIKNNGDHTKCADWLDVKSNQRVANHMSLRTTRGCRAFYTHYFDDYDEESDSKKKKIRKKIMNEKSTELKRRDSKDSGKGGSVSSNTVRKSSDDSNHVLSPYSDPVTPEQEEPGDAPASDKDVLTSKWQPKVVLLKIPPDVIHKNDSSPLEDDVDKTEAVTVNCVEESGPEPGVDVRLLQETEVEVQKTKSGTKKKKISREKPKEVQVDQVVSTDINENNVKSDQVIEKVETEKVTSKPIKYDKVKNVTQVRHKTDTKDKDKHKHRSSSHSSEKRRKHDSPTISPKERSNNDHSQKSREKRASEPPKKSKPTSSSKIKDCRGINSSEFKELTRKLSELDGDRIVEAKKLVEGKDKRNKEHKYKVKQEEKKEKHESKSKEQDSRKKVPCRTEDDKQVKPTKPVASADVVKNDKHLASLSNNRKRKKPRFRNLHSTEDGKSSSEDEVTTVCKKDETDIAKVKKRREEDRAEKRRKDYKKDEGEVKKKKLKSSLSTSELNLIKILDDDVGINSGKKKSNEDRLSVKDDKCRGNVVSGEDDGNGRKLKNKDWKCDVCGFDKCSERVKHIKQHSFHCQSCYLAFKSESSFTQHLLKEHKECHRQDHCLICELSFDSLQEYKEHLESRNHKHIEYVEKNTINTLFTVLTGQHCPAIGPVSVRPEWLPNQAGTVHFYHQATPLSLALQYLKNMQEESPSVLSMSDVKKTELLHR